MNAPAANWAITRTVQINRTLEVVMSAGPLGFVCEWAPDRPRKLNRKEIRRYRSARNALLSEVAERLGGNVLVVELGGAGA
jgi:hypothetical protein